MNKYRIIHLINKCFYLLHVSGIIGNGLLDSSDSAPLSATDISMTTLIPLVAVTMDRLAVVNATASISHISTGTFHQESPSTDPSMSDSSSSSSSPLDATPTSTADWLLGFSTISALSSVEPTSTNTEPGEERGSGTCSEVQQWWSGCNVAAFWICLLGYVSFPRCSEDRETSAL